MREHVPPLLGNRLAPLEVCLPSVVNEFAHQVRHLAAQLSAPQHGQAACSRPSTCIYGVAVMHRAHIYRHKLGKLGIWEHPKLHCTGPTNRHFKFASTVKCSRPEAGKAKQAACTSEALALIATAWQAAPYADRLGT